MESKITSGTNEFLQACPTSNIIGVTGTKGKGTTSTLIAKMLEPLVGRQVHLAGNIGIPALSLMPMVQPEDWVVLELSSFQLADLQHSPHIGVCLMMAPEHLDTHGSLEAYVAAKSRLFAKQTADDIAVYYYGDATSEQIASSGHALKVPYYHTPGAEVVDGAIIMGDQTICQTSELRLLGQHNWQNVCAAVTTVWQAVKPMVDSPKPTNLLAIRQVLENFTGLPFRIEFRREVNGVRYFNDSFASAPPTTIAAIKAVPGHKVLILGGFDRNLDITELIKGISAANDLRQVLIVGAAKERIAQALTKTGCTNFTLSTANTMPQIVAEATTLATNGDAVILSPGFPSFDMFKDFEDRGRQFNQAVELL